AGRVHPQARKDGGGHGDEDDAQILHEGDQPLVGAEGAGHQHHGGGGARRGAPDGGGAGQDAPAADEPAEHAGGDQRGGDRAEDERPVGGEDREDAWRDRGGDQTADDRLRGAEDRPRHPHGGAVDARSDAGQHRPDQQRGGQGGGLQRGGAEQRQDEDGQPLERRRAGRQA